MTPTELNQQVSPTLKGSNQGPKFDPFRVRKRFLLLTVGVAQRSPTAINLNPSGIRESPLVLLREQTCQQKD